MDVFAGVDERLYSFLFSVYFARWMGGIRPQQLQDSQGNKKPFGFKWRLIITLVFLQLSEMYVYLHLNFFIGCGVKGHLV